GKRAISRIGPDLKVAPDVDETRKERQHLSLFWSEQHIDARKARGCCADALERRRLAKPHLHAVVIEGSGHGKRSRCHERSQKRVRAILGEIGQFSQTRKGRATLVQRQRRAGAERGSQRSSKNTRVLSEVCRAARRPWACRPRSRVRRVR